MSHWLSAELNAHCVFEFGQTVIPLQHMNLITSAQKEEEE